MPHSIRNGEWSIYDVSIPIECSGTVVGASDTTRYLLGDKSLVMPAEYATQIRNASLVVATVSMQISSHTLQSPREAYAQSPVPLL